jgi:hypothetical protein
MRLAACGAALLLCGCIFTHDMVQRDIHWYASARNEYAPGVLSDRYPPGTRRGVFTGVRPVHGTWYRAYAFPGVLAGREDRVLEVLVPATPDPIDPEPGLVREAPKARAAIAPAVLVPVPYRFWLRKIFYRGGASVFPDLAAAEPRPDVIVLWFGARDRAELAWLGGEDEKTDRWYLPVTSELAWDRRSRLWWHVKHGAYLWSVPMDLLTYMFQAPHLAE